MVYRPPLAGQRGLSKTALVLAGGGVTGVVYEIGALRALDEMVTAHSSSDFDIYVGTSAGAIVGSLLANGIRPEAMLAIMEGRHPGVRPLRQQDVFAWDGAGLRRWCAGLPRALQRAWAGRLWPLDLPALLLALSEALPPALYDNSALERYLREALAALGASDDFESLERELYLVATDLTTGQRAVFGPRRLNGNALAEHASISQAVAASTALPVLYKPVRLGRGLYADGGLRGSASLDVAVERGARLVVCINPIVPYLPPGAEGHDGDALARRSFRIATHAGLHYHIKHLRRAYPKVDIVCIEPEADDEVLLTTNTMDYGARHRLAAHAYGTVRQSLAERRADFAAIFARHGIAVAPQPLAQPATASDGAGSSLHRAEPLAPRSSGHGGNGRRAALDVQPE